MMVEDFDAVGVIPTDWTATVNTPAFPDPPSGVQEGWQVLNAAGVTASYGANTIYWNPLPPDNGGAFAVANDDQCNCDASNDVLTTPMFDMSQYDSLWFFFDLFNTEQWGSTGSFDYTIDGGNNWLTIALPADPADWQGLYLPLDGPFGDVQFSFVHSDGSTNGNDIWAGGLAVDSILFVGFNTPCDDIINIASCGAPQTVSLSGTGVNDWNFTSSCGWDVPGAEQLYSFTPTVTGIHTLDVTSTTAVSWLDYMYKPANLGCDTLNWICIDDVQNPGSFGMNLTAGIQYLILVDNEFVDLETQTFSITCPCTYVSQGNTPESETCGADLNGGCNTDPGPAVYEQIACGGSISGTLWADGGTRDTDWFELVVTENTDVVVDFSGGMPINVFLIDNCTDLTTLALETSAACASANLTWAVTPGTYLLAVVPTVFESYPCGSGSANLYDLTVTYCEPVVNTDPCLTSIDVWGDLNIAGGAPCNDGNGCTPTDPNFTAFGVYGSETYLLNDVQAGFDYVFSICTGVGAGNWIPEIAIVAPDGTTVDAWNGEPATGSSLTFIDQCTLGWTASQSGTYSIIINELGTAAGDAPNQIDCNTSYAVDNGNPTVSCGQNPATCPPVEPCLTSADTWADLNTAGGAPCFNGTVCEATDPDFTTNGIGVYGSETYLLDNVEAGFDYVFDMCTGVGVGSWIPEIAIVAPDGTTVDAWNGEAATGSSLTFLDQCSIGWTASQSGTYSIIINELGTAAGDAPNQVDCNTSYAVNNGNPTVECGPNPALCLTVGVGFEADRNFKLYPNPSNGTFTIEISGLTANAHLNVTDMMGRVVYQESVNIIGSFKKDFSLNVAKGTYMLQVVSESVNAVHKIEVN